MKLKDFIEDFFLTIISPYLLEIILFPIALLVLYAKNILLLFLVLFLLSFYSFLNGTKTTKTHTSLC